MKTNSILLQELTASELQNLFAETVKDQITAVLRELQRSQYNEILLSREETANLLKIDISTLHTWDKKGFIKSYGIGHRRYYKRAEILQSLIEVKK